MKDCTPNTLSQIAIEILGIKNGDTVADLCCGNGNFLRNVGDSFNDVKLYGNDISVDCCKNAQVQLGEIEANFHIECSNMFDVDVNKSFDKVFIHPPFGIKVKDDESAQRFFETQFAGLNATANISMGLMCIKLAESMLSKNGKALVIAPAMTTTRKTDLPLRRLFVDRGLIESVVAFPEGILETSAVPTVGFVVSRNNTQIKFFNAKLDGAIKRNSSEQMKRQVVSQVFQLITNDNEYSKITSQEDVKSRQYTLNPEEYHWHSYNLKNPVRLEDMCVGISRRAFSKRTNFENCNPTDSREVYSVKIADMDDGLVSPQLVSEADVAKTQKGVKLENGDVLLSKIAAPVKTAIYEEEEKKDVFAQENIYVVRVDQARINPHYLCAFLNSEIGIELLRRKSAGSYIPSITLSDLKDLEIPLLDFAVQERIGEEFKTKCEKLRRLRDELELERNQLKLVCDEKMVL